MATIIKTDVVVICTTPDELRKLADQIQAYWNNAKIGDSATVTKWLDKDIIIEWQVNDDKMYINKNGLGNKEIT